MEQKRRKRDEFARELREQLASQEQFMAKRKEQEDALDQAFRRLNDMEIEKELSKQHDTTKEAKREMAQYRAHLKELEKERKQEEELLNKLVAEYQEIIEKKREEAKCKLKKAKEELQKVYCLLSVDNFCINILPISGSNEEPRRANTVQTTRS